MKLVTLNTWGKCGPYQERWDYFVQELMELKPDILCLQEVCDEELTQILKSAFGFTQSASAYDSGLLIISNMAFLDSQILTYQYQSPSERSDERKAIMTKIKFAETELVIANTHLAWREKDRPTRDEQMRELLEVLRKIRIPAIICGDLNDIPESSPLKQTRAAGYENILQIYHPDAISWDNRNPFIQSHLAMFPDRQIDYILVHESESKILKTVQCQLAFNQANEKLIYPSDHYGIFARINSISDSLKARNV